MPRCRQRLPWNSVHTQKVSLLTISQTCHVCSHAIFEVEPKHDDTVGSKSWQVLTSLLYMLQLNNRKAPINMWSFRKATKTQQIECRQHPRKTSEFFLVATSRSETFNKNFAYLRFRSCTPKIPCFNHLTNYLFLSHILCHFLCGW